MLSDKREKKTMKKKILVLAAALGLISNNANAQYLTAAGQSYINRFSVAPAFAGFNENAEGFVGYRSFMAGIEEQPNF
jgi:ABC-type taurine transport system substrate-binding protein